MTQYPLHDPTKPPHAPPRVQVTAHVRLEMATRIAAGILATRLVATRRPAHIAQAAFELADELLKEANR